MGGKRYYMVWVSQGEGKGVRGVDGCVRGSEGTR